MIKFKQVKLKAEFKKADNRLKLIVFAMAGWMEFAFVQDVVITSVKRDDEKSVHHYSRGVDFRITPKNGKPIYTDFQIRAIKKFFESIVYDDKHPTLLIHDSGSGLHGHLQVNSGKETVIK